MSINDRIVIDDIDISYDEAKILLEKVDNKIFNNEWLEYQDLYLIDKISIHDDPKNDNLLLKVYKHCYPEYEKYWQSLMCIY